MVKVVFLGTPAFAVPTLERLLASPHEVIAAVTQPDRPRGRGQRVSESSIKQVAKVHDVPVLQPYKMKDPSFVETLAQLAPDLGVVAAYGKILPDQLLTLPRLGMINVHASLLPKYRGAAPIHRAVMAGEAETGITIIRLVREMDAGPILRRAAHPIGPEQTSEVLEQELAKLGADLLMQTANELDAGRTSEELQDHSRATLAPRLTKADGLIDWRVPASAVHNQVRALHPWPHAYSYLEGSRYVIRRTAVPTVWATDETNSEPGEVLRAAGDLLLVATGMGTALEILELQPEGRRSLLTRAFLAGHHIRPGTVFRSGPS